MSSELCSSFGYIIVVSPASVSWSVMANYTLVLTADLLIRRGVKLPSRRPALVCESCLYSEDAQSRVRAFHVLDPRGLLDVIGVFHESREGESFAESQKKLANDFATRVDAVLGKWSGQLVTRRTGIYGATLAECNVQVHYEKDDEGKMKQVLSLSLSSNFSSLLNVTQIISKGAIYC